MQLEIRIPITPDPNYVRQVEYVVRSWRANGGRAANARFVVSLGGDCEPWDLTETYPWSRGQVQWRWVNREEFRAIKIRACNLDRFRYDTDADIVLMADADTLLIRPIDDLLESLAQQQIIAGVMAHVPPFWQTPVTWQQVFGARGRPLPSDRFEHTGWGVMFTEPVNRFAPAYYNFGVVFIPSRMVLPIGTQIERELANMQSIPAHAIYGSQLALTFAMYELWYPHCALPFRYNFANLDWADRRYLTDLADVRIIHYLKEDVIGSRRQTWGSDEAFTAFLARRDLSGSNEVLRSAVARLSTLKWA